ncbi:peritrophin-44 [Drosophila nasuta]|uniref:peritrophin-44 n=1 Tax=Drosophila nasuta TaxID=42062 RepID=UPI00295F1B8A|nr:peritrophin-44 [Drosophila nasuta]
MKGRNLVNCLALLLLANFATSQRVEDICQLFSDGTVLRDPESCSRSITCQDAKSTYTTCTGSTPFFNKDTLKCVKTLDDSDGCDVTCANSTAKFINDPKSCFGYYYCADEQTPMYGKCAAGQHFNGTTQRCVWTQHSTCTAASFDYCSIIKNGVSFDSNLGCNRYYECTKGALVDNTCKTGYYDARSGACISKSLVHCDAHPYPTNVCGTAKSPKINAYVADGATCHGYFYCTQTSDGSPDPAPKWGHCGDDLFFDATSQICTTPIKVACSEDRCQGRTIPFVLSATKGCRNYLRCSNGVTKDEKSCAGNLFFDEEQGSCVAEILKFAAC